MAEKRSAALTLPTERRRQRSLTRQKCQVILTLVSELPDPSLNSASDAAGSADPAEGLRSVRALQRLQERLEAIHVANAREQGWSWQAIANALGVSRQAVHQKYNRRR